MALLLDATEITAKLHRLIAEAFRLKAEAREDFEAARKEIEKIVLT